MTSLDTLFETTGTAFSKGDLAGANLPMDMPKAVYVGDQIMMVNSVGAMENILLTYRENLCRVGYSRTHMRPVKCSILRSGGIKYGLQWVHLDRFDKPINVVDTDYYCRRNVDGEWGVDMIEFGPPKRPDLLQGLPLQ
jgi:hypothetical protein